ncbi:MAG: N-6 DNA Methylase [bacterium ADurb.Bin429]|nr:MAG: N-6 DNA Methylase [bacterium ADurb.Bin429]
MEVLDWTAGALNRVDRAAFFQKFQDEHAVQYFYEPFLEAFDPELRKELGVWYTPPEIVKYMVARVDRVLREELGIADGLASEDVYVLDPCCGTGAYLVEVLRKIKETLDEAHLGALADLTLKKAATERVFGFEILPAPFVVAHLQLGLLLHTLGEPLADERVGVFLTNALTGWAPPDEQAKARLSQLGLHYPEFKAEYDAAAGVKRGKKILVVLGNPPYNGFAGMAVQEERDLSDAYRRAKRAPQPQGQGLNDLYIRFYRMAERQIVEHAHRGVVCFISNYSWLDGLSFTGMRERYLEAFDTIFIDNLHGDRIISEYAPDGRTSETVFAMQGTSVGIKVGTAIATLVVAEGKGDGQVCYRDFEQARADERRKALLASLDAEDLHPYETLQPVLELGLPFKPRAVRSDYLAWPLLPELFPVSYPGIQPCRDDLVVDITHDRLVSRMKQYFDSAVSNEEIAQISPIALKTTDRYDAIVVRQMLVKRGLLCDNFVPYTYRPFDNRWLYWEPETKLLDEKRAEYVPHVTPNNLWMALAQRNRKAFDPPCVALHHASRHLIERGANLFPLLLRTDQSQGSLFGDAESYRENISAIASVYISQIGCAAEELFFHAIASLHAPQYCSENSGALRQDWPRIPLPASGEALRASAALGRRVAALLDPEAPVTGVTARPVRGELAIIAAPAQIVGGGLRAELTWPI